MSKNGKWDLAPAYDLSYAYNPEGEWTSSHQMSINGKRTGIRIDDLTAFGNTIGLKNNEIKEELDCVKKAIQKWPEFAESAQLSPAVAQKIYNVIRI